MDILDGSLSLGVNTTPLVILWDKWALVGEVSGVNNFNGYKRDDPVSGFLGIQYMLSDNFVLDAGVEIGMNKAAPDFRLTTGVTFFFKP
jgi:putative salt-induced outer membrane protein YdiY